MSNLRFALLARVSTETQESQGVSLEVQRNTLLKCIEMLGGECVKEYIGSESATFGEGKERPILDEMMMDMNKGIFNALIVYDFSRLTRDPIKSKIILVELRKNNIKLFSQTQEHNLYSPESNFFMGLMSEVNAFTVAMQLQKAQSSKLELARRGWLVYGSPPFGRYVEQSQDKSGEAVWCLDSKKLQFAQQIYDLYINQRMYVDKIGNLLSIDNSILFRIIHDKGYFVQTFEQGGETISIKTKVPELFTPEQKNNLLAMMKNNKSKNAKKIDYLLGGLVKCPICHLNFSAITIHKSRILYYRHSKYRITDRCLKATRGDKLDIAVMLNIAKIISDQDLLMQTIKQSNSNSSIEKDRISLEQRALENKKEKLEEKKSRILKLLINGTVTEEEMSKPLSELRKELEEVEKRLLANHYLMKSLDVEIPLDMVSRIQAMYDSLVAQHGKDITQWGLSIKSRILQWFFGLNPDHGIFLTPDDTFDNETGPSKAVSYTLITSLGTLSCGLIDDSKIVFNHPDKEHYAASLTSNTIRDFANIMNELQNTDGLNRKGVGGDRHAFLPIARAASPDAVL